MAQPYTDGEAVPGLTCECLLTYCRDMDAVFHALDDAGRRALLDALVAEDGQTLQALCAVLPEMTRFGVMSHLRVLEDAGLVVTEKVGRSKHHYLNPVPIRLVLDRWIAKYTEPIVGRMAGIARHLEGTAMTTKPVHVYRIYIAAPASEVWNAIVDGDTTVRYFYGTRVVSTWESGAPVAYHYPDGTLAADGVVIACDPPHRLEYTFHPRWDPELEAEGPTRQVWLVEEADGATRLSVELYGVAATSKTVAEFTGGFAFIVSGLKTVVETGRSLAEA